MAESTTAVAAGGTSVGRHSRVDFSGRDLGRDYVEVSGSDWDDERSPGSVNLAIVAARSARDAARS
jgi:hypothetical protein